jgi:hypothetical protein
MPINYNQAIQPYSMSKLEDMHPLFAFFEKVVHLLVNPNELKQWDWMLCKASQNGPLVCNMNVSFPQLCILWLSIPYQEGRVGKIQFPQKNAAKINKIIKYFVEINKNEVNKNCRQKTKENV